MHRPNLIQFFVINWEIFSRKLITLKIRNIVGVNPYTIKHKKQ